MAKRKFDCCINGLIVDYLKKRKCEGTLQLLDQKDKYSKNQKVKHSKHNLSEKFMNYLKQSAAEKRDPTDDLGFEINFGVFEPVAKVSLVIFVSYKCNRVLSLTSLFSCRRKNFSNIESRKTKVSRKKLKSEKQSRKILSRRSKNLE